MAVLGCVDERITLHQPVIMIISLTLASQIVNFYRYDNGLQTGHGPGLGSSKVLVLGT